ncbi:HEAT repeat domain-containing protein [Frigoriglobus tundricola]|uniref:HEAT repeat domain-containing protein n=1 Tax=Frigoriglobus tundricola TaxID=2774151 RepID=A0A6M5YLG4_9BACT|nr:HEAT repeat domain-containing protein [Frigoriglobus tundricola]QJW94867.1 hypothetical protein FTUN_2393 [Frigoriglobus tundricola]
MRRLFATVGALGMAAGGVFGEPDSAPAPAPASVSAGSPAELVPRLGADDFRTREAAVAALERSGAAAIPALREAMKSDDPEVRLRAATILHKLQRTADSAAKLTPAKITLAYKNVPLGTAVSDLKTRTGLNLSFDLTQIADPLRKITCVTGELSTWEALDAFCAAAGLVEQFQQELEVPKVQIPGRRGYTPPPQVPSADAVPIVLIDGKAARLPGDRRTAVRVLAIPAAFPGHRVTLGTGETTLCFDVTPAPGLNWQDVTAVKITKLIDDAGRAGGSGSARPANEGASDEFEGGVVAFGGPAIRFGGPIGLGRFDPRTGAPIYPDTVANPRVVAVPLKLATPTARRIKRMEGLVLGEVTLTNQKLITVTDPAKNTGVPFEGAGQLRMTVVGVTQAKGGGTTVQLLLEYPSPWSVAARRGGNPGGIWPEVPRASNQTPTVQSFDATGKAVPATVASNYTDSSDDGQVLMQHLGLSFRKDAGVPSKLVVVGPRAMTVEVPFVMENVPLP